MRQSGSTVKATIYLPQEAAAHLENPMTKNIMLIVAACVASGSAIGQTTLPAQLPAQLGTSNLFTETVYMGSYNPSDDTYTATVNISATPCPGTNYSVNIGTRAKNPELAKDSVKDQVNKITNDIQRDYNKCHPH